MKAPDHGHRFAVSSPSGVHIGLWEDGLIAAKVAAEKDGNTVEELVTRAHADTLIAEAVAGAYEAAADFVMNGDYRGVEEAALMVSRLTPADAQAALTARDARVREEVLREAIGICEDISNVSLTDATSDYDAGHSDGADQCYHALLALQEKEQNTPETR